MRKKIIYFYFFIRLKSFFSRPIRELSINGSKQPAWFNKYGTTTDAKQDEKGIEKASRACNLNISAIRF
jgi:hypothetical protein